MAKPSTHCRNGHPFDEKNTAVSTKDGRTRRRCRSCHNHYTQASRRRIYEKRLGYDLPKGPVASEGDGRWTELAACRGKDIAIWFPSSQGDYAAARPICSGCPVIAQCLDYARRNKIRHGMFGGKSPAERGRR